MNEKLKLLRPAKVEMAYLKAGILGFPGSGKTRTASDLAIGISKRLGDGKPVAFFDSESGSDFLVPRFEREKIELFVVKSQSFSDLLAAAKEAESICSVMIVDSISHVWKELCESYRKRRKINKLQFQHWADIKQEWSAWTAFYLNSKMHIIVCGRAGYEYDFDVNEDGTKELIKTGTKMKAESEFGFEPSLLIEMERAERSAEVGSGWIHRAHILKDRTDSINGKSFDFAKAESKAGDWLNTYKPFEPVLKFLNIGGEHRVIDTARTSEERFNERGEGEYRQEQTRRQIAIEEMGGILDALWPGSTAAAKLLRATAVFEIFGTHSKTKVEAAPIAQLEQAVKIYTKLQSSLGGCEEVTPEVVKAEIAATSAALMNEAPKNNGKVSIQEDEIIFCAEK